MHVISFWGVVLCLLPLGLQAQQSKPAVAGGARPAGAEVFDDLPVEDAAVVSALGHGEDAGEKVRNNIFVKADFDRPGCYVGEQVLLTYRLYTALASNSTVKEKPVMNGFVAKERTVTDGSGRDTVRDGKHYRVFTIWSGVLTPLQAGIFSVDPLLVNNVISYTAPDGKLRTYSGEVSSNRAGIRVIPLPVTGQPAGFAGAVGSWTVGCRLSDPRVRVGDADTLWVTMEGKGSFDNLPPPVLRLPTGLKGLPAVERWNVRENSFPVEGLKVVGLPFTATKPGTYVLPAISLTYFDPGTRNYRAAVGDSLRVEVDASGATASGGTTVDKARERTSNAWLWWIGAGAVVLLGMAGNVVRRRRKAEAQRIEAQRAKLAMEEQERIQASQHWTAELAGIRTITDEQAYLVAVKQLVIAWLREQLKAGNLREEDLLRMLRVKDMAGAAIVGAVLDRCNNLIYAVGTMGQEERIEVQGRVEGLIDHFIINQYV